MCRCRRRSLPRGSAAVCLACPRAPARCGTRSLATATARSHSVSDCGPVCGVSHAAPKAQSHSRRRQDLLLVHVEQDWPANPALILWVSCALAPAVRTWGLRASRSVNLKTANEQDRPPGISGVSIHKIRGGLAYHCPRAEGQDCPKQVDWSGPRQAPVLRAHARGNKLARQEPSRDCE